MWREYLKKSSSEDNYLIPMQEEDFSGLPHCYIEPNEMDILHDEAIVYAQMLGQAGVDVTVHEISGSYHGFDADTDNPFVQEVIRSRMDWMSDLLNNHQ